MKKLLFLLAAMVAMAGAAVAGSVDRHTVNIGPWSTGNLASGSTFGARSSTDTTQFIGCFVYAMSNGYRSVGCSARTASGQRLSCVNDDPAVNAPLINVAQSISSSSYMYFISDGFGKCDTIYVDNSSRFVP